MPLNPRQREVLERLQREGENGIPTGALLRTKGEPRSYMRRTLNSLVQRGLAVYVCDHLQVMRPDGNWQDLGCYENSFRYVHRDFIDRHFKDRVPADAMSPRRG